MKKTQNSFKNPKHRKRNFSKIQGNVCEFREQKMAQKHHEIHMKTSAKRKNRLIKMVRYDKVAYEQRR